MSTLKTTNLQHASAGSPAIVLDAAGDATYAGTHDFSAATVTGVGKILQVVEARTNTGTTTSSTTYVDTSLSASITPSSASSKVLILNSNAYTRNTNFQNQAYLGLFRDATALEAQSQTYSQDGIYTPASLTILDSPNTTSAVTYKTRVKSDAAGINAHVAGRQVLVLMEVAV